METSTEDGPLWSDKSGVDGLESVSCEVCGALSLSFVLDEARTWLSVLWLLSIRDICSALRAGGLELAL